MQISTRMERILSLPRSLLLVIVLAVVLTVSGGVYYLWRSQPGNLSPASSPPAGIQCVPAPVVQAPPPPPGAAQASQAPRTSQSAICPPRYVPQPTGHSAPKGMPRP